ncbi:MAG: Vgb family protein [Acidimicrobiales bacterium]
MGPTPSVASSPTTQGRATGPPAGSAADPAVLGSPPPVSPPIAVREFALPTAASGPLALVAGPDGNIWFVELAANKIGRITASGDISEFPIPTAGAAPSSIARGPDSNLWFTETQANKIEGSRRPAP